MTERFILFSAPMVKAILSDQKVQTRRLCKGQRELSSHHDFPAYKCPYGSPGDHLWVREAWRLPVDLNKDNAKTISERARKAGYPSAWAPVQYEADGTRQAWDESVWGTQAGRYRHARFMPRWASRVTLEIVSIRVERVQDISEEDARAEGTQEPSVASLIGGGDVTERRVFSRLWAKINGPESWKINPWVWVVGFKRVKVSP